LYSFATSFKGIFGWQQATCKKPHPLFSSGFKAFLKKIFMESVFYLGEIQVLSDCVIKHYPLVQQPKPMLAVAREYPLLN
jgi:hypothetical protein